MNSEYLPTYLSAYGICGIRGLNKKIRVNNDQKNMELSHFYFVNEEIQITYYIF